MMMVIFFISSRDLRESDANGFVQRAISAVNVYNNIVKYIDDANITSLTTLNKSERADEVGFTVFKSHDRSHRPQSAPCAAFQTVAEINIQLKELVTESNHVFKESVSIHSEQNGLSHFLFLNQNEI